MSMNPMDALSRSYPQKFVTAPKSKSFPAYMESPNTIVKPETQSSKENVIWPPTPANYKSSANINDTEIYDDAKLAKDILQYEGAAVSTEKKINWGASGDHQLTQEEIKMLKEKYDVTDLSAQDYYNLLSDLTNLNAISAEEAVSKYLSKSELPFTGWNTCVVLCGKYAGLGSYQHQPVTNMVKLLLDGKKYLSWGKEYVKSDSFQQLNHVLLEQNPALFPQFSDTFEEKYQFNERLLSVFSQLIRDGSEWVDAISETENEIEQAKSTAEYRSVQTESSNNYPIVYRRDSVIPPRESLLELMSKSLMSGWEEAQRKDFFDLLHNERQTNR